ncbi:MAG: lytic transglycosylase domain-containing protein [Nocardioidaceae bacterium]
MAGLALAGTGLAVTTGVVVQSAGPDEVAEAVQAAGSDTTPTPRAVAATRILDLGDRAEAVSRSASRDRVDLTKARALDQAPGEAATETEKIAPRNPRAVARALLAQRGWSGQFSCLDSIYVNESGWDTHADNPTSSAYGIPQALPGAKMASAGADWRDNPATQIKWGLGYIAARYGTPCAAWSFKQANGWY